MVQAQSMSDVMMSRNGKLYVGMTRDDMQKKCEGESERASRKLMKAFEMADGAVDGMKDGVIAAEEIAAYDKEVRKKNWRTGLMIAGGVVVTVITAFAVAKGIKANQMKELAAQNNPHNLMNVETAEEVGKMAQKEIGSKPYRVATAGYSAPPEGYEESTKGFLEKLKEMLGGKKTAFVTSPTASAGSIDAITTDVAGLKKGDIFYTSAQEYTEYINPSEFPATIDKKAYSKLVKHVLPNGAEYSKATAEASNMFIATGGRNATVSDFVNAINKGNKAVVLNNPSISAPAWGDAKKRVENASKYLLEQFEAFKAGKELPYPEVGEFTKEFMTKNTSKLEKLMKIITLGGSDNASIAQAAKEAAAFLA